jgi:hypothetical protein
LYRSIIEKKGKKMKYLENIPRNLNLKNIDYAIEKYYIEINKIPLIIRANNIIELMKKLKRDKIGYGPYPDVAVFESANRIMTDLVILKGVKLLLNGIIKDICFPEYIVEYGNENNNEHDITACDGIKKLKCEVFNTAESFFQIKKAKSLNKLRKNKTENEIILIMYNIDAVTKNYSPKNNTNEYSLAVNIEE